MTARTGNQSTIPDATTFAPVHAWVASLATAVDPVVFYPATQSRLGAWVRSYNTGYLPDLETPMSIVQVLQNTPMTLSVFMRDATGVGLTGISTSAFVIKQKKSNQSSFSVITPTVTETGLGWYDLAITAGMTDTYGKSPLDISAPNALTRDDIVLDVIALNQFTDPVRAGLSALPNAAAGGVGGLSTDGIRTGTAQGAGTGSNQIVLDAGASATDGFYNRTMIVLTGGTGAGQARFIANYVGSTKTATVQRPWKTNPDNTTTFAITALTSNLLAEGLAQAGAASSVTLASSEPSTTDIYKGLWVHIISGTGAGQARLIVGYNGTTKVATVDSAWATAPDSTSVYQMLTGATSPGVYLIQNTIWDEVLTGATHNVPSSAGRRLRNLGALSIYDNTAQGAGTGNNQIQLDAGASSTDDLYHRNIITITGGTGVGQSRIIVRYNGTTKVATVNHNWQINPDATSTFQITASSNVLLGEGLAQAGAATTITLMASEPSTTDFYKGIWIHIVSGTGQGQARLVTAYNGTTKVATVDTAWAVNPDSTSAYAFLTGADVTTGASLITTDVNVAKWLGNVPNPLSGGNVQADVEQWKTTPVAAADGAGNVPADVQEWEGQVPAALTSGFVQAATQAINNTSTDAIATAILDKSLSGHNTAGTVGAALTNIVTPAAIATAVLDAARSGHVVLGSIGEGVALATSLLQGNYYMDNVVNSDPNGQTSARIRCFHTGAAAGAATPGGSGEGEFATFVVTTTYTGPNKINIHKVVQQ